MELIKLKEKIESKVALIEKIRGVINERGQLKAEAIAEYDKAIAVTLIQLKNGVDIDLDGQTINNPPASIMDKVSKGVCYEQKLKMELADAMYKSAISNLDAVKAELNGLQTLNKYFE